MAQQPAALILGASRAFGSVEATRSPESNKRSKPAAVSLGTSVVHLKRAKGQVVQDCDVYIGRAWNKGGWSLPESKWANKKRLPNDQYKRLTVLNPLLMASLHELKGKRLGCWCKPKPCHGDTLVELVDLYCQDEENTDSWWPQEPALKKPAPAPAAAAATTNTA